MVVKIILVIKNTVTFCDHYSSYYIEKIKHEPGKLANFAFELFNEIKLCYEFNKSIDFFWKKDYQLRWRDYDGETGAFYLKDCDDYS